ncbi:Asp-tRNA(Asn)/Glu-tRNA(Gln) amidotransferase GatCAB subunit C [bacterium]|nr:Asp-tRNA(Asn)/Glu-tRNA(Gln) amidotransferase GatCAB subunit C [bacterium]NBX78104.1 Asp-tRNA(Asn)/Glu-tRNA(Gln) amidotransferase GatCAB subunit C [bacterium]
MYKGLCMENITQEEVLKIAALSKIEIAQQDIPELVRRLQNVLSYAERVQDIAKEAEIVLFKNINADREDVVVSSDTQAILKQAPQEENGYFVVPKIIDN